MCYLAEFCLILDKEMISKGCFCIQLYHPYSGPGPLRWRVLLHAKDCLLKAAVDILAHTQRRFLWELPYLHSAAEPVEEEDNEIFFFPLNHVTKGK